MGYVNRQPSWKEKHTFSPGVATLLGVALGWALAFLCAFTPPRDFSYSILLLLLGSLGFFGGIFGYILWLSGEPVQFERLQRITSRMAWTAILGLLIAFPGFWRQAVSSPILGVVLFGGICAAAMFVVGAGRGIAHLVGYLVVTLRKFTSPAADIWTDGVWDRELDQG